MPVVHAGITPEPLDIDHHWQLVQDPACGATVVMTGQVRDHHEGHAVERLEYEAYEDMAVSVLDEIAGEALARWQGARIALTHRTGPLDIGGVSVIVAVSTPHRGEAFEACQWCIDTLKERLPVWKKEYGPGGARWQEGRPLEPDGTGGQA